MSIQWFERLVGSLRGPGAKRSRKRLNDALRPTRRRRRQALNGFETLEERRVLAAVLGIGTSALVGNDLTDLGNNGVEGSYSPPSNLAGFDGVFFANLKPNFGSFQAAFNVFDNRAGGAGDDKALWGFPAEPNQLQPMIVGANFATTHGPTVLTSFTITSGEDTPERDPTRWKIEGSNDTTTGLNGTWTTIYDKAVGGSHWTQRQQVNRYSPADGDVFLTSQPFTAFRMVTTATGIWTQGTVQGNKDLFQLSEIEFFGVPGNNSPAVNLSVSSATGTEVGTTAITVNATAASAVTGAQTVSLAVTGTGITTGDYALSNSTITIPNGATSGSVTFSVKDDLLNEGTETATLTISSPSAGITLGTTLTQNIVITDDDSAGASTYGLPVTGAYRLVRNGSTIEIYNSTLVLVASRAMGTAAVVINGTSGNDSLTIDLSGGNFTVPITFNGGSQTSTPGDSLALTGGTFTTGTFAFTNANDGTINLTGNSQFNYTGLEPIVTTGTTINDLILTFNGGAETITLTDATGAAMTIDSTLGESLTFANPSNSLTINAGTGDDIVNITNVDEAFRGAVSINGDSGSDTVNWDAAATLGSVSATGNVSVVADVITATNAISADTGRLIAVSLAATGNVTLSGANADATTGGGTFTVIADSDANGSGTFTSDDAGSAVSASGGAISIKAADVVLTGTLAATSTLTLVPSTAGRTIGIGGGAGTFNLSDAELALLTDGFSSITIGDAAAGNIDINTATFTDSVVLNTSGKVNDATGADINVGGGNTLTINGSVAAGQSPGILDLTGNLLLNAVPTVLLTDDFNDNSIDSTKWNVVTAGIPQPGASVIETGGRIQLTGRGHLNTVAALNPSAPGGLVITGTWQFGSGDDFLQILTRSDGTPAGTFGGTNQGIELSIRANNLMILGMGSAGPTVIGGTSVAIPQGATAGDIFQFTLTDNGTTITGTITEVGVPANTATVTATSNFVSATNRVTFTNRESNRVSYLDNVVIRSALLAGYNVEIGGTTPGESATSHDQINVAGTVTIGTGVTLNLSNFMSNYTPSGGDQIVIVNNDASDAIIGTFVMGSGGTDSNGGQLADGDTITNFLGSSRSFRIFYNGGDGNDVVLVENSTPAVVYVDDSFTANVGQTIPDADFGTTGSQPAIFGATAFSTINAALAAVTSSGTIIVNGGTYAETVSLTGTRTMEITGPNSAQTVIIDDLTTIAGTPVVIEGSSNLTVGDADSRTLAGVISGSGSFTKAGSGTYTLSGSNVYTGATNINAGTLRVAGTPAVPAAPAGAVGIYTFDSVSGATVNNAGSAGTGKNGALVAGSAVVGGGRSGNAMSTSGGTGARMQIANAGISLAGNWTGAAWFNNLFTDGDWNSLFVDSNTGDAQVIIQNETNRLGVYTGDFRSSGFDLVPAANSGWHHVAAVGSGTTTTFYRNGVFVGTADRKSGTNIFTVGASSNGAQRFAQLIDDVYIYQSALTPAEITTLYNSGAGIGAGITANPIPDSSTVTIAGGAFLDLNGSSETIGSLAGAGTVTSGIAGSPTLTVGNGNGSGSFSGAVQNGAGTVSLAKTGTGTQTLSGSNLYTGATAVNNGTLVINGSVTSNVTVTTPGALNGSGTVTGNVLGNGTFSPGNSPGIMTIVGNFTPSGTVNFEVNSAWTTAGTHFDQYLVTGLVNMAGSTVTFTNTADASGPAANSVIKLIDNNGTIDLTTVSTSPVNGALITIGSRSFKLFYNGGDGNDVTLESQNAAPTSANSSVTTNEDFTYTFSATDFNFSDTDSGDVLSAVQVTTIESAGDLEWFNGSSWVGVTQDQEISKADIDANRLRFVPAANANGSPYATFGYKVKDTGGPVLSVAAYTLTINVSAINDLPVAQSSSVTTNEDTAKTFAVGDFLFTDVEGDSLASITISSLNLASGDTLKLSGTDVTVGQTITAANIPNLVYAPFSNANGAARSSFGFTANDASNGTVAATMTINVTAVDDAPVLTINDTSIYVENAVPTVVAPNLTLTDTDGPNVSGAAVSLTTNFNPAQDSLQFTNQNGISGSYNPATGILRLNGSATAAAYQTALRSVTYSNNSQNPTSGARSVQFSVGSSTLANPANGHFYEFVSANGGSWTNANAAASARTLFGLQGYLATVTSASENAFIAGKLIGQGWMGASDADVEGTWKWVTGPEAGQVFWQGAGGGSAVNGMYNNWTPGEPNNFGPFGEDYAHFRIDNSWNDYRVDNGSTQGYVVEYGGMPGDPTLLQLIGTSTVSVVAVNDAPSGANKTLTTNEDTQLTIIAADFGFSDVAESHAFNRVQITTLPATGTLRLNGVAISAGDFATKAQLDANQLTFDPVADASGSPYTAFTFQVEDDGGTDNGGVNLDLTPNTITINVSAVNDAPSGANNTLTTNEDTQLTIVAADLGFSDATEGHAFNRVKITTLPTNGTLKLNGVPISAGDFVTKAQLDANQLTFEPVANATSANAGFIDFTWSGTVGNDPTIGGFGNSGWFYNGSQLANGTAISFTYSIASTISDSDPSPTAGRFAGGQLRVQIPSLGVNLAPTESYDLRYLDGSTDAIFADPSDGTGWAILADWLGATNPWQNVNQLSPLVNYPTPVQLIGTSPNSSFTLNLAGGNSLSTSFTEQLTGVVVASVSGSPYTAFTFQVEDDGGTDNGGVNLDLTPKTIAINVSAINDVPVAQTSSVTTNEDTAMTFAVSDFLFTDVEGDSVASITISSLNLASGDSLKLSGADVTVGQTITAADISNLVYAPFANANGLARSSFGFTANDAGSGTVATTLTINVTAVSDVSISDASVTEGGNLQFTVSLDSPVDVDTFITFSTANGSATTADSDYTSQTLQTLTIPAGQTSGTIIIVTTADNKVELDETMTVQLTSVNASGRNVTIDDGSGRGTMLNDDTATVSINNPSVLETNSGTTTLAFTVSLDKPVDVAVSATINTANGITNPATIADSDYAALTNGTVTFSAGSTSQSVNVTINGDSKLELNEQLQLVLSALSASGRSVQFTGAATTLTAIGTITNDDTPRVGSILQPTSVTTTMGSFGAPWAATKMIDKSGLSVGYTSNVTNFDTYIAGNPTHSYNAHQITPADAQAWASSNSVLTGTITFNLGSMYAVESMALWNRIDAGIGGFNLLADADGDFNSGAVTVLSNRTALLGRSGAQVFGFTPTNAQYLRLQVLSDAHSFPFVIINEIAFEGSQITVDATPPTSQITALAPNSSSLVIPITVTGSDGGSLVSGVKEYDLYYSTGGGFVKFATVPASSPSTTFTGAANTTYWFRSLGRDNAGNEETKTTSDTSTRFGDVVPPATQVTTAVPTSGGLFTVSMTGSKATGSALAAFDVYVSIDGGAIVLIRSANAVSLGGGNYSGKIPFQGILDGTSHTYRFYSRGRDDAGNVEAAPVVADLSVTHSFAAAGLKATAIDVQKGANQRSYVRSVDVLFSSAAGLSDLLAAGRVKVERFGIDATSVSPGTGSLVTGFALTQSDRALSLDFGVGGLGGLNQAGNGFYRILIDMDGNNSFGDSGDSAFEFFRLLGDANGDGKVDSTDLSLVTSQVGRVGNNVDGDLDGNGVVNALDRLFATQQNGRKLRDSLFGWLDD